MKTYVCLVFLLLNLPQLFGQGENNHWVTKSYDIDFNGNRPILHDQTGIANITPNSTVSDRQGNLLFYSDGIQVMNRNFEFLPGGIFLKGTFSQDQTSLFVPNPIDTNLYYLFTNNIRKSEIQYSVIDRRLDNGLGAVVNGKKNIPFAINMSLLMVAAKGVCGSVWMILHENDKNRFLSYEINENGISSPIHSEVGDLINIDDDGNPFNFFSSTGRAIVSPNSEKIAVFNNRKSRIHLFKFNRRNGLISNELIIPFELGSLELSQNNLGVFSGDNTKLYVNQAIISPFESTETSYFQLDLSSDNQQQIIDSQIFIGKSPNTYLSHFKRSSDNVIYISNSSTHFSGIRFPNELGTACEFVDTMLIIPNWRDNTDLTQNPVVAADLPSEKDSMFLPADANFCNLDQLAIDVSAMGDNYRWQDGSIDPNYTISQEGKFWVEVSKGNCVFRDTIEVVSTPPQLDLGADTTLCKDEKLDVQLPTENAKYQWNDGSIGSNFSINAAGEYWVEAIDGNCITRDTVLVSFNDLNLDLGTDITLCEAEIIELDASTLDATYLWQDGSENAIFFAKNEGWYWAEISKNGCTARDSLLINIESLAIDLGKDTTFCEGQSLVLFANNTIGNIRWQDESSNSKFEAREAGTYWVENFTNYCLAKDTILVETESCLPDKCNLFIPNVFSPNDDGENDQFQIFSNCELADFNLEIYDRWGNRLFETTDIQQYWDGKRNNQVLQNGVYLVKTSYRVPDKRRTETKFETLTIIK